MTSLCGEPCIKCDLVNLFLSDLTSRYISVQGTDHSKVEGDLFLKVQNNQNLALP